MRGAKDVAGRRKEARWRTPQANNGENYGTTPEYREALRCNITFSETEPGPIYAGYGRNARAELWRPVRGSTGQVDGARQIQGIPTRRGSRQVDGSTTTTKHPGTEVMSTDGRLAPRRGRGQHVRHVETPCMDATSPGSGCGPAHRNDGMQDDVQRAPAPGPRQQPPASPARPRARQGSTTL